MVKNPYAYTQADLTTVTNERVSLKQGADKGMMVLWHWLNEPCTKHKHFAGMYRLKCSQCCAELDKELK